MVAMAIFMLMAAGLGGSFIYALKISEYNMNEFAARTAAQSYLEQLRVVDYGSILKSLTDPSVELPTLAVDLTPSSNTSTMENSPLMINSWVTKDIPMVTSSTGTGNNRKMESAMSAKFRVEATNRNISSATSSAYQCLEIKIKVQWLPPGVTDWSKAREASYATVRSSVP